MPKQTRLALIAIWTSLLISLAQQASILAPALWRLGLSGWLLALFFLHSTSWRVAFLLLLQQRRGWARFILVLIGLIEALNADGPWILQQTKYATHAEFSYFHFISKVTCYVDLVAALMLFSPKSGAWFRQEAKSSSEMSKAWHVLTPPLSMLALVMLMAFVGTMGEMMHGQLLRTGESLFGDPASGVQYFLLRADPIPPTCDPHAESVRLCQDKEATYRAINQRITPSLRAYRAFETSFFEVFHAWVEAKKVYWKEMDEEAAAGYI